MGTHLRDFLLYIVLAHLTMHKVFVLILVCAVCSCSCFPWPICSPKERRVLQEHCLDNLPSGKFTLSNITILKCQHTWDEELGKPGVFFKYLRHGIRDHCTCTVEYTPYGPKQTSNPAC